LGGADMTGNPLLLLTVVAGLAAVQFFGLGLLGEVSARIYHECQGEKPYRIRTMRNLNHLTSREGTYSLEAARDGRRAA
jgi:hypothetical protein